MTRSCSSTTRPRSIVSSDIRHTVRAGVPVSPSNRDVVAFAHPKFRAPWPIPHYLISPMAAHSRLLTTFLRPLTTLDEIACVVYPVLHSCPLAFSRHLCSPRLYFSCSYCSFFFLFHARRPECFCTPDFSSYHMPNYDTPNPLSHSFCLLAVYTCTWN